MNKDKKDKIKQNNRKDFGLLYDILMSGGGYDDYKQELQDQSMPDESQHRLTEKDVLTSLILSRDEQQNINSLGGHVFDRAGDMLTQGKTFGQLQQQYSNNPYTGTSSSSTNSNDSSGMSFGPDYAQLGIITNNIVGQGLNSAYGDEYNDFKNIFDMSRDSLQRLGENIGGAASDDAVAKFEYERLSNIPKFTIGGDSASRLNEYYSQMANIGQKKQLLEKKGTGAVIGDFLNSTGAGAMQGMKYGGANWISALAGAGIGGLTNIANQVMEKRTRERKINPEIQLYNTGIDQADVLYANNSLSSDRLNYLNQNQLPYYNNIGAFGGKMKHIHDNGGYLNSHYDYITDPLVRIDAGGTHQENPNEGVQTSIDPDGEPNLVEQGETIINDKEDAYVFSDRIVADKDILKSHLLPEKLAGKTYADISKELDKIIQEHKNDEISKRTFDEMIHRLQEAQEDQKFQEKQEEIGKFIDGLTDEQKDALEENIVNQIQAEQEQVQAEQQAEQQAAQEQAVAEQQVPQQEQVPQEAIVAPQQQAVPSRYDEMMNRAQITDAANGGMFGNGGHLHQSIDSYIYNGEPVVDNEFLRYYQNLPQRQLETDLAYEQKRKQDIENAWKANHPVIQADDEPWDIKNERKKRIENQREYQELLDNMSIATDYAGATLGSNNYMTPSKFFNSFTFPVGAAAVAGAAIANPQAVLGLIKDAALYEGINEASKYYTGKTWGENVGQGVENLTGWNPRDTYLGEFVTDMTTPVGLANKAIDKVVDGSIKRGIDKGAEMVRNWYRNQYPGQVAQVNIPGVGNVDVVLERPLTTNVPVDLMNESGAFGNVAGKAIGTSWWNRDMANLHRKERRAKNKVQEEDELPIQNNSKQTKSKPKNTNTNGKSNKKQNTEQPKPSEQQPENKGPQTYTDEKGQRIYRDEKGDEYVIVDTYVETPNERADRIIDETSKRLEEIERKEKEKTIPNKKKNNKRRVLVGTIGTIGAYEGGRNILKSNINTTDEMKAVNNLGGVENVVYANPETDSLGVKEDSDGIVRIHVPESIKNRYKYKDPLGAETEKEQEIQQLLNQIDSVLNTNSGDNHTKQSGGPLYIRTDNWNRDAYPILNSLGDFAFFKSDYLGDQYKKNKKLSVDYDFGNYNFGNYDFEKPNKESNVEQYSDNKSNTYSPKKLSTFARYAPIIGSGVQYLNDIFGFTNRNDYTNPNMVQRQADRLSEIQPNFMGTYKNFIPFDEMSQQNMMLSQQNAMRRAALNNSNGNAGAALATLNSMNRNYYDSLGELALQSREYNNKQRQAVDEYNTNIAQINSSLSMTAQEKNQAIANQKAELYYKIATMRQSIEDENDAARGINRSKFYENLGKYGTENFVMNQVNSNEGLYYWVDGDGIAHYKSQYYGLSDEDKKAVDNELEQRGKSINKTTNNGFLVENRFRYPYLFSSNLMFNPYR